MIVASQLYEQGKRSLGQAAEVAGLTKRTCAELLGNYDVSISNFPASDPSGDVNYFSSAEGPYMPGTGTFNNLR
ncbi:UPF0175 family protein [Agriterribacter sp.]|uniref:UPF0175 family protein n=1 Tax=Agriterribacter sp. TaxID=2821509 RepID=UPI0039C89FC0